LEDYLKDLLLDYAQENLKSIKDPIERRMHKETINWAKDIVKNVAPGHDDHYHFTLKIPNKIEI